MGFLNLWSKLSESGCRSDVFERERRRMRLTNQHALIICSLILLYTPFLLFLGLKDLALFTLLYAPLYALIIPLHRCFPGSSLGRLTYIALNNITIVIYCLMLGRPTGVQFFFIAAMGTPFVVLDMKRRFTFLVSLLAPFLLFFLLELSVFDQVPSLVQSPHLQRALYLAIAPFVFVTSIMFAGYFYWTNEESERKLWQHIDELKQSRRTVEEQQTHLAQTSRLSAIGELSGGIAHEINNPLAIIQGYAEQIQIIARRPACDIEQIKTAAEKITSTVNRISKIIVSLRKLSHDGEQDPFEVCDIRAIIEEAIGMCHERMRSVDIRVDFIDPGFPCLVHARLIQLSQVFVNILQNAKEAIETLDTRMIIISIDVEGPNYAIRIRDSGHGLKPDVAARIGQPFFTTKGPGKGTGLGLSISKKIAEAHGGTLKLDAASFHTTFVLSLPLYKEGFRESYLGFTASQRTPDFSSAAAAPSDFSGF